MKTINKIYLGIILGAIIIFISLSQFVFQTDNYDNLSFKIAKHTAKAVYGCCKKDPGDECNAYGAIIHNCDECFILGRCNKPDPE